MSSLGKRLKTELSAWVASGLIDELRKAPPAAKDARPRVEVTSARSHRLFIRRLWMDGVVSP